MCIQKDTYLMIKIDFDDTYDLYECGENLSFITFFTTLFDNSKLLLKVIIAPLNNPLLPNVFNLSFGPMMENGDINDTIKIKHKNINKVFSTIIFYALTFIKNNESISIGVDGSNDARAYLYHRMFISNKDYLKEYFDTIGVDWYVRLLRNNEIECDATGYAFFKPKPEPFDYIRKSTDLYRYYIFK